MTCNGSPKGAALRTCTRAARPTERDGGRGGGGARERRGAARLAAPPPMPRAAWRKAMRPARRTCTACAPPALRAPRLVCHATRRARRGAMRAATPASWRRALWTERAPTHPLGLATEAATPANKRRGTHPSGARLGGAARRTPPARHQTSGAPRARGVAPRARASGCPPPPAAGSIKSERQPLTTLQLDPLPARPVAPDQTRRCSSPQPAPVRKMPQAAPITETPKARAMPV